MQFLQKAPAVKKPRMFDFLKRKAPAAAAARREDEDVPDVIDPRLIAGAIRDLTPSEHFVLISEVAKFSKTPDNPNAEEMSAYFKSIGFDFSAISFAEITTLIKDKTPSLDDVKACMNAITKSLGQSLFKDISAGKYLKDFFGKLQSETFPLLQKILHHQYLLD